MRATTRRAALLLAAGSCLAVAPAAPAAKPAFLSVKAAGALITKAERSGMQTNPTYTGFEVGTCLRLSGTRVNCVLTRHFDKSSCPSRVIVYLRKGYPKFITKPTGPCVAS